MENKSFIKEIEKLRKSRMIVYITNDRQGPMNGRISMDIIPIISRQLRKIKQADKIDLFLYSAGGDTMVPWRLVSMIREYCKTFSVLVPYKAHSAATMISLGADEIVMSDLSEISPIDPSTANFFNPADPFNPQNKIPISVEDVMSYFDLAKNKFEIKNDHDLASIFMKFIESSPQIHPIALGNINRTHNLIRILAKKLLKSHRKPMSDDDIDKIVDFFTEKLFSHQYYIGRREAKDELGVKNVVYADEGLSDLMTSLFDIYKAEMETDKAFNPETELGINISNQRTTYKVAYLETSDTSKYYYIVADYKKQQVMMQQLSPHGPVQVPQEQVVVKIVEQGWK